MRGPCSGLHEGKFWKLLHIRADELVPVLLFAVIVGATGA
jgi:hypothetical protein